MKMTRGAFITGAVCLGAGAAAKLRLRAEPEAAVRFGLVADPHYSSKDPSYGRHFRDSLAKFGEAVAAFNDARVDFAVELGDFKDEIGGKPSTIADLERIEAVFATFKGPRYHAPGNHDFDCLTPEEFYSRTPNGGVVTKTGYYSFDVRGVTFIVLNGCHTSDMKPYCESNPWMDANIPPEQAAWLKERLAAAGRHAVVFCHQRLDPAAESRHRIRNAEQIRKILEESGKVRAVVTGHEHGGGSCRHNGIPYYTLKAMVTASAAERNSYALGVLHPSGAFTVEGFRNADSFS